MRNGTLLCCTELHHSITPPQKGKQTNKGRQLDSGAVRNMELRSLPRSLHCGEKHRKELKKWKPEIETKPETRVRQERRSNENWNLLSEYAATNISTKIKQSNNEVLGVKVVEISMQKASPPKETTTKAQSEQNLNHQTYP
jgi:hypothetical protein